MFDESTAQHLLTAASTASGVDAIRAWARVEAAACARRLSSMADILDRRMAADGSAEREQWCLDNWDAVSAEVAAAQSITLGAASNQLLGALALRDRLPRVAEVFAAGLVNHRLINTIVFRTALIQDPHALAKVDGELAAHIAGWEPMSAKKTEQAIDYWVDRYDSGALRRTELAARSRSVEIAAPDGTGITSIWGSLYAQDAAALDRLLDAMARAVCSEDPRSVAQRRADALGALARRDRLACRCGNSGCPAADDGRIEGIVIHVVAGADSLTGETGPELNGTASEPITTAHLRDMPLSQALKPPPAKGPSKAGPGVVVGGGILPAPVVAELARRATIRPIVHPGNAPPEPRYRPSAALETFVRCRDLTCRFPGCDRPADFCDIDHTIAYDAGGPTHASNLKCLCRRHHLLKTFWCGVYGWSDRQLPDGTVIWTSPSGHTYTTRPGSRLLLPALSLPTGTLP
jgi:hypothetical protein